MTDRPPAISLGIGDTAVAGWLGTFCWQGTCLDMPRLPQKETLPEVDAIFGQTVSFEIDDEIVGADAQIAFWRAAYRSGAGHEPIELAAGGTDIDPDSSATPPPGLLSGDFRAPPAGDWIVSISVRFLTGDDAIYAWHFVSR